MSAVITVYENAEADTPVSLFQRDGSTPFDLTGATAVALVVKKWADDDDADAVLTLASPATITVDPDPTTGNLVLNFPVITLDPGTYRYRLDVTMPTGKITALSDHLEVRNT